MKMSVVGCEASGKTVFMSALADYYNGCEGRLCLVPENESANNFQRFQLRQMRSLHLWPPATDPGKTIELKWTLRKGGKTISEIDMLEFGGETFREAFRGEKASESHQAAVDALKQHLSDSQFVVVLVSLKDLLRDQGAMTAEEFERDSEALWVTRGLLEFLGEHAPKARVVIGLTQADLHRDEIAAAGSAAKLFRQRWPSVAAVAHDFPVLPIASVSATDENGNPAPDYTTDGILPVMEEFKKAKRPAPGPRRTVLLLLLLFAFAGLWFTYAPKPVSLARLVQVPVVERIVQTNVVESIVLTTNVVNNVVTTTNVVENVITHTNVVEAVAAPVPTDSLRTWRDHNGTPIEAKWISTTDDRKRIVLETADGKRIRAAIRKFSAADQQFIAERLEARSK